MSTTGKHIFVFLAYIVVGMLVGANSSEALSFRIAITAVVLTLFLFATWFIEQERHWHLFTATAGLILGMYLTQAPIQIVRQLQARTTPQASIAR